MENEIKIEKIEEFAKKIVRIAEEDGLTVSELHTAADIARGIAFNSAIDSGSITRTEFPFFVR